jgi:hypothetical protein
MRVVQATAFRDLRRRTAVTISSNRQLEDALDALLLRLLDPCVTDVCKKRDRASLGNRRTRDERER